MLFISLDWMVVLTAGELPPWRPTRRNSGRSGGEGAEGRDNWLAVLAFRARGDLLHDTSEAPSAMGTCQ